jgi:hypothetical protein
MGKDVILAKISRSRPPGSPTGRVAGPCGAGERRWPTEGEVATGGREPRYGHGLVPACRSPACRGEAGDDHAPHIVAGFWLSQAVLWVELRSPLPHSLVATPGDRTAGVRRIFFWTANHFRRTNGESIIDFHQTTRKWDARVWGRNETE